jgi:hypothetical protein
MRLVIIKGTFQFLQCTQLKCSINKNGTADTAIEVENNPSSLYKTSDYPYQHGA